MTDDYIEFEGQIVPIEWGRSVYTVLRLPSDVTEALDGATRVEGEINDHPVNLSPQTAPVIEGQFLWTGKTLLKEIGIEPGERVTVRLRPADPNAVDVPEDVTLAIRAGGMTEAWGALTPGKQRGLLHQINTAKRAETRAKRIASLVADLAKI